MSRLSLTLSALLATASLLPAQTIHVGDTLPPTVLDGLTQTEAHAYSDFYGRAVLLEFFAFWCRPCAQSVPHVNELQEKFGARGFSVVGVTAEGAAKTEPWIAKTGAKYAYGYDTTNTLHKEFEVTGIPFAVLIDPFGTVVWTGHPMGLDEKKIEEVLQGAADVPVWKWPAEVRPLAAMLARGEYAGALQKAATLAPSDGFDAAAFVKGRVTAMTARFESYVQRKEYGEAMHFGERVEKLLAGLPESAAFTARMNELRADPEVVHEAAASATLADLEARAIKIHKASEARKMREEAAKFLEQEVGHRYERRARNLVEALDRALQRAPKGDDEEPDTGGAKDSGNG